MIKLAKAIGLASSVTKDKILLYCESANAFYFYTGTLGEGVVCVNKSTGNTSIEHITTALIDANCDVEGLIDID